MPTLVLTSALSFLPASTLSRHNTQRISPASAYLKVGLISKDTQLHRRCLYPGSLFLKVGLKDTQLVGFSSGQRERTSPWPMFKALGFPPKSGGGSVTDEWIQKLPDKKKPLYSHSLPCIEAWLRSLGFHQSKENRAVWHIQKPDWYAQLSMDIADLYIRYLKSGPGNLERDIERKFSYALSREDLENAILGGP